MYKYHNLNPISQVGLDEFTKDYAPVSTPETADAVSYTHLTLPTT